MAVNTFFIAKGNPGVDRMVGVVALYAYFGYTSMVLARRLGAKRPWFAWIPFLNLYLMTEMAALPWWWMLGFFVPFINFFVAGYLWSEIGKRLGKPWWIGALVAIPLIGWLVPGYFVITTGSISRPHVIHQKPSA